MIDFMGVEQRHHSAVWLFFQNKLRTMEMVLQKKRSDTHAEGGQMAVSVIYRIVIGKARRKWEHGKNISKI